MNPPPMDVIVNDRLHGTVDPAINENEPAGTTVRVRLDDGHVLEAPRSGLTPRGDGTLALAVEPSMLDAALAAAGGDVSATADQVVVPIVEEQFRVRPTPVETGRVRIVKTVREDRETIDAPLMHEQVTVDRVPVNQFVQGPVSVRFDGETMIVPILEEVLVVEKRLMLKEELHVRKQAFERREPHEVTLRVEEAHVERAGPRPAEPR